MNHKVNAKHLARGERLAPRLALLLSALTLCASRALAAEPGAAPAADPDAAMQLYAKNLAISVCGSCHGVDGNSEFPKFPKLAGQNRDYLDAQMKAFRDQTRGDADAIGYMWGMSRQLNDATIAALANYYAKQRPLEPHSGDATQTSRGRQIYLNGVEAQGVPACSACHGPDAHGLAQFPRLAGQHAQYVLKQLQSFQSNMRDIAVMHGVARGLQDGEMEAVADYLESQP